MEHRHSFYPTNTELAYTYDTANIVSIDEYNVLHAIAAGTVTVTATTDTGVSTTFTIAVTDPDFIILPGDVNDDGIINIIDSMWLSHFVRHKRTKKTKKDQIFKNCFFLIDKVLQK